MSRRCKCCDKVVGELPIKCGYCGDVIFQGGTSRHGKWFHVNCFRDFKNFYSSLYSVEAVNVDRKLQIFRDYILGEMIMRHDVRMLRKQWLLLVAGKALPLDTPENIRNEMIAI